MNALTVILLIFLIICAIAVSFSRNILNSILIFMSYSLVMSVLWIIYESPDLAITEAAVGAGVTSLLFFVTLKKIRRISLEEEKNVARQEREKAGITDEDRIGLEEELVERIVETAKKELD